MIWTSTRAKRAELSAAIFNAENQIGTPVRYWTGVREGDGAPGKTRSKAFVQWYAAVVFVEGCDSCIPLTHIESIHDL